MSEFRQNPATREWVIIAPGRYEKPTDFIAPTHKPRVPRREASCPFCPGNEAQCGSETLAVRPKASQANGLGWKIRVVPNKYPTVIPSPQGITISQQTQEGPYLRMEGFGHHEVVVEHPFHNQTIVTMTMPEVRRILEAYLQRYHDFSLEEGNRLLTVFRNYGEKAGASLRHPHSQLITTGIVPLGIQIRLDESRRYFEDKGTCAWCDLLQYECRKKERLVLENKGYAVFVPYAAGAPYEMWLMPKHHQASFGQVSKEELSDWAQALQGGLTRLCTRLGDPDFNYILHTAPFSLAQTPFYHWQMQIIPHLKTKRAGFEMGSGININIVSPEAAAKALRQGK